MLQYNFEFRLISNLPFAKIYRLAKQASCLKKRN